MHDDGNFLIIFALGKDEPARNILLDKRAGYDNMRARLSFLYIGNTERLNRRAGVSAPIERLRVRCQRKRHHTQSQKKHAFLHKNTSIER